MKLELSSEGRYALRALVYLARDAERGELVTADRISAEAAVPRRLLARVMAKLARAGLVESSEGRGGGTGPDSLRDCSSSTVRCRPSRNLIVMTWNDPIRRRRSRLAHFLFRYRYIVSGAKTAMSMAHDKSNQPI